ncbi:hypothetical protein [Bradyrhizobium sp. USDA 4353]
MEKSSVFGINYQLDIELVAVVRYRRVVYGDLTSTPTLSPSTAFRLLESRRFEDADGMPAAKKKQRKKSPRRDGRISTLIYIEAKLLDQVQEIAAAQDRAAWRVIEDAVKRALEIKKA